MPGFTVPGVLFLGAVHQSERAFCKPVYAGLREQGYTRFVELCSGAFAMSLVAVDAGWTPDQIEASDVSLFSSVLGYLVSDQDLQELQVAVDGEVVELPDGDPIDQAAWLLWLQHRLRLEAKPDAAYWINLASDVRARAGEHQDHMKGKLTALRDRLGGLSYRPLDLWVHLDEVADDPHTVVNASPPSYKAGFERFYDTNERLTWAEPPYGIFDPELDYPRLVKRMEGQPALLINLEEGQPGHAHERTPVYARQMSGGLTAYLHSNRPEEIFAITGGPKIAPRASRTLEPADFRILPRDYDVRPDSRFEYVKVPAHVADYYRNVWMHRLVASPGHMNTAVLIDGYLAGLFAYNVDSMNWPMPNGSKSGYDHLIILRYAVGAPHSSLRLTRLMTMAALQWSAIQPMITPAVALYVGASKGLVTVEYTKHPEAKGLRGLMKLSERRPHADGNQLFYVAPWSDRTDRETLTEFLTKEAKWQKARASG